MQKQLLTNPQETAQIRAFRWEIPRLHAFQSTGLAVGDCVDGSGGVKLEAVATCDAGTRGWVTGGCGAGNHPQVASNYGCRNGQDTGESGFCLNGQSPGPHPCGVGGDATSNCNTGPAV